MADEATPQSSNISVDPPVDRLDTELFGRSGLSDRIYRGELLLPGSSDQARVHVLHGLGGSGKTHLALDIAKKALRAGRWVWWVPTSQLTSGMREVATRIKAPERDVDRAWAGLTSASDLVWRHLNATKHPWILIFDNADEPEILGPAHGRVADGTGWLRRPETSAGTVLVTTRDGARSTWGNWSSLHTILPLRAEDGGKLLHERATAASGTLSEARELSTALGGLPLALRAAGDYLRSVHTSRVYPGTEAVRTFRGYRDKLRQRRGLALAPTNHLTEILGKQVVEEVFTISLELLHRRGLPHAAALVRVLAAFDNAPLPYTEVLRADVLADSPLFPEPTPPLALLQDMADLALISLDVDGSRDDVYSYQLTLHPLVQAIARSDEQTRHNWSEYQRLAIDLLLAATEAISPDTPSTAPAWHLLEPHVTEVAHTYLTSRRPVAEDAQTTKGALELARRSMRYLISTRLLLPAQDLLTSMIAASAHHGFEADSPEVLSLRHELARVALERNEFVTAEEQLRAVIRARTRVLGALHADTLASGHKIGRAIMGQGRWQEAEELLRHILVGEAQLAEALRRPYDVEVIRHSLARAVRFQGRERAAEAERHVSQALTTLLTMREPTESEVLFCYDTLAQCLADQGRFEEAEEVVLRALRTTSATDAEREQVTWLNNTLRTIQSQRTEDHGSILESLRSAASELRQRLGDLHPEYLRAMRMLAELETHAGSLSAGGGTVV